MSSGGWTITPKEAKERRKSRTEAVLQRGFYKFKKEIEDYFAHPLMLFDPVIRVHFPETFEVVAEIKAKLSAEGWRPLQITRAPLGQDGFLLSLNLDELE